jgi:hypothetical protein
VWESEVGEREAEREGERERESWPCLEVSSSCMHFVRFALHAHTPPPPARPRLAGSAPWSQKSEASDLETSPARFLQISRSELQSSGTDQKKQTRRRTMTVRLFVSNRR